MRMKIEDIKVFGFEPALHAMRNPMDSWADSDSRFYGESSLRTTLRKPPWNEAATVPEFPQIGPNDLELAKKLIIRGSEHRKFMRQIIIWFNITIPRYVWQELDTYKVATVRNSCSTMNKLGSRDLEQTDFQFDIPEDLLAHINKLGQLLRDAKEEHDGVREARQRLKNDLPEGFLQKATYTFSYETGLSACLQRAGHRLPEWRKGSEDSIVETILSLPYMRDFYEAATWKKNQRRGVVTALSELCALVPDGEGFLRISAGDLINLRDKLKKAV